MDNATPVEFEEELTVKVPRQSMRDLVYGAEFFYQEPAQAEYDGEDYL